MKVSWRLLVEIRISASSDIGDGVSGSGKFSAGKDCSFCRSLRRRA